MTATFMCTTCGIQGERLLLEAHWRSSGHGPENAQRDAIARARLSVAPAPPSITTEGGVVLRLKPRPDPPGDLA